MDFFRGYPTVAQSISALKKGAELVRDNALFTDLKTSAAVLDTLSGGALSLGIGAPAVTDAPSGGGGSIFGLETGCEPSEEEMEELTTCACDFVEAVDDMRPELTAHRTTFAASFDRGAIDSTKLISLLMALMELWKQFRT